MAFKRIAVDKITDQTNVDRLLEDNGATVVTEQGIFFEKNEDTSYDVQFIGEPVIEEDGTRRQNILVQSKLFPEVPQVFLDNLTQNTFESMASSLHAELTTEESYNVDFETPKDLMGVDFVYNFADFNYERTLSDVTNHNVIPNINVMMDQTYQEENDLAENLLKKDLVKTLKDNIRENLLTSVLNASKFVSYTNQIIPPESNTYLREYAESVYSFPMYCMINIPYTGGNDIAIALKDSGLGCMLIRDVFGAYPEEEGPPDSVTTENLNYSYTYYDLSTLNEPKNVDNLYITANTLELLNWKNNDLPSWYDGIPKPNDWSYIGADQYSALLSESPSRLYVGLAADALESQLHAIFQQKARSFKQIYDGEEAYSETVMYQVIKYLGEGIDTPLQSFYFYNTSDLYEFMSSEKKVSFADTQVKYAQKYTYSVVAYQAIVASRYEYNFVQNVEINNEEFTSIAPELEVVARPFLKIVEMPLFQTVGKIMSLPPLPPEATFVPIKGETSLLKMNLNTALGEEDMVPIAFSSEEEDDHTYMKLSQKRNDGMISFSADDNNTSYEIYRISKPPTSYSDFINNLFTTVGTTQDVLEAGAANITVKQATNKKYYYTFRSVDRHGSISNPSEIYEIELYNDGGVGYPIIRRYEIGEQDPKTGTKSARKYIQIIPRITQAYLNETDSGIQNSDGSTSVANKNLSLGVEAEPLFGKRFKVRITSKSTGKKVDINLDFRTNRITSEIE